MGRSLGLVSPAAPTATSGCCGIDPDNYYIDRNSRDNVRRLADAG
jgi:hypothetical protein